MKKLSRNEAIGVTTALVVALSVLFFGKFIFNVGQVAPSSSEQAAAVASNPVVDSVATVFSIEDNVVGEGAVASSGDLVSVHYTGTLLDGTKFDSSHDRGAPIQFTLDSGEIIRGFDQGVAGMKVGGIRKITIPPELGYGSNPVGPIPANSSLIFLVELVAVSK